MGGPISTVLKAQLGNRLESASIMIAVMDVQVEMQFALDSI